MPSTHITRLPRCRARWENSHHNLPSPTTNWQIKEGQCERFYGHTFLGIEHKIGTLSWIDHWFFLSV